MCRYFCTGFINFTLAGKTLTELTNLFSPNNFQKNDDIILNYFMRKFVKWNPVVDPERICEFSNLKYSVKIDNDFDQICHGLICYYGFSI